MDNDRIERRFIPATELRAEDDDGKKLKGYAAVFEQWSEDLGWFREQIARGAFAESIKADDIRALWNHDPNWVLGRNRAGTLTLAEDERGLRIENQPPETQWARDLVISIERGDVNQMSFAFAALEEKWNFEADPWERTLLKVRLFDVSPVTFPAYPQTDVQAARSAEAILRSQVAMSGAVLEQVTAAWQELRDLSAARKGAEARAAATAIRELAARSASLAGIDMLRRRLDLAERQ